MFLLFFHLSFGISSSRAQGTLRFVATGGGDPLLSRSEIRSLAGLPVPAIQFKFGFVTDEVLVPDSFLDSFTITLTGASSLSAVLVTVDASGALWSPPSAGSVLLPASRILRQPIVPPDGNPVLGRGAAYSVLVPVPAELLGDSITASFDLFDNDDTKMSLGWYDDLQIVPVPEPCCLGIFTFGSLLLILLKRRYS